MSLWEVNDSAFLVLYSYWESQHHQHAAFILTIHFVICPLTLSTFKVLLCARTDVCFALVIAHFYSAQDLFTSKT